MRDQFVGRRTKNRRQSHGSAWHWKQTDGWYYTLPGTRKRVPLRDDRGERIRGKDQKAAADIALARAKLASEVDAAGATGGGEWLVARVCSEYLQYCERGVANGSISQGHRDNSTAWLNDLCEYCGAVPVAQLKQAHVEEWIARHASWRSPATRRSVIAVVLAAFNRGEKMFGIANPTQRPEETDVEAALASFTPDEEQSLYGATEPCFGEFPVRGHSHGLAPIL